MADDKVMTSHQVILSAAGISLGIQIGAVSLEETERAHSTQKAWWAEPFLRYGRPKF